jgi:lysyl-tRNA synthetase class 2
MSENDENHLITERRAKLAKLRERGIAFPNDFRRNALAGDLLTAYGEKPAEALDAAAIRARSRYSCRVAHSAILTMNSKPGMSAM